MPTWLTYTLIAAAIVVLFLWVEAKVNLIVTEIKALRKSFNKLAEQSSSRKDDELDKRELAG